MNPAKAAAFGQQLQARGLVMGTVTQQNDRYVIASRVVDIETGVQVAGATVSCGRSDELDGKYGKVQPGKAEVKDDPRGQVVKLFDALKPLQSNGVRRQKLGTFSVGGNVYDDCVGYWIEGGRGFYVFDLGNTHQWKELVGTYGNADQGGQWARAGLRILLDGEVVFEGPSQSDKVPSFRVPLTGVRTVKIHFLAQGDGLVVPGDFQLVSGE